MLSPEFEAYHQDCASMPARPPKLVLLPGLDGTGRLFKDFIAALPRTLETVAIGYPADRCLPYADLAAIVQSNLPTPEPFVLLAESFSTPLAIHCARTHPQGLKGLVLCCGFATSPVQPALRMAFSLLAPTLLRIPLSDFAMKTVLVGPSPSPALLLEARNAVSSVGRDVMITRVREVLNCDVRAALTKISLPTLYLRAKQDRLVGSRSCDEIRRLRPRTTIAEIDGPHLLLQAKPQQAAEVVAKFISQLSP
jgi:pimeloyl-[acyl-carrier protein] methyl ester esterase